MRYYELQLNEAIDQQEAVKTILPFLKRKFPGKVIAPAPVGFEVPYVSKEKFGIKDLEPDKLIYIDQKFAKLSDFLAKAKQEGPVNYEGTKGPLVFELYYRVYPAGVITCTVEYSHFPKIPEARTSFWIGTQKALNGFEAYIKQLLQAEENENRRAAEKAQDELRVINLHKLTKEQLDQYKAQILKDCAPWFAAIKNDPKTVVLRGIDHDIGDIKLLAQAESREPLSSTFEYHDFLNELIEEKGLVANRNSVFGTGQSGDWQNYGPYGYVVLPTGQFHFTWSKKSDDLGEYDEDYNSYYEEENDAAIEKLATKILNGLLGDDGSLLKAIKSGHEIMLIGEDRKLWIMKFTVYEQMFNTDLF
jgi:hypothetical protein